MNTEYSTRSPGATHSAFLQPSLLPAAARALSQNRPLDFNGFLDSLRQRPVRVFRERVTGIFTGVASGDALGMAVETLSAAKIAEVFGRLTDYQAPYDHQWFQNCPAGTWTDDMQLTIAVAQSISGRGPIDMARVAAAHVAAYRDTTLGWGGSTREAVEQLIAGVAWSKSGFSNKPKRGTGNGVAMKVAPLGVYAACAQRPVDELVQTMVDLSGMTHPTSMAVSSALAHMAAVAYCLSVNPESFNHGHFIQLVVSASQCGRNYFPETNGKDDISARFETLSRWPEYQPQRIISDFGAGSCYVYDSLPFSYMFFLRNPHNIESLFDVVNAGGDTDSNGALVGALLGALHGPSIFPERLATGFRAFDKVNAGLEHLCRVLDIDRT